MIKDYKEEHIEAKYIGPSEIQVKDGKMTPEVLLSLGRLSDPQISPDGKKILYGVSYTSIPENRSCRNLFICDADGSNKVQLTKEGSSISNARWSNDGKSVIYIQDGQIHAGELFHKGPLCRLHKVHQISNIANEVSEFKLSPDQTMLMYVSTVRSNVKTPVDIDSTLTKADAYVAEDLMYRHWNHWVKDIPHTFVAKYSGEENSIQDSTSKDILAHESELYELPLEPFSGIEQLNWSPDSKYIAYSCKKETGKRYAFSTNTEIYLYSVKTEDTSLINMGGGYDTDPVWSPDGKKIAWLSMARDGYEADKTRLMLANVFYSALIEMPVVTNIRDVTASFKYNAAGPVWDPNSSKIYFNALAEGLQGIFRVDLDRLTDSTGIERVTGEDKWFDFSSPFSIHENGSSTDLLAPYCSMKFPTEIAHIKISGQEDGNIQEDSERMDPVNGSRIISVLKADCPLVKEKVSITQVTHENDHILSQLDDYTTQARIIKTVDNKDMLTWVLYPPKFDSTKLYPSILITLGGPQGTLSQDWSYRWCYRLMAAQGYVVILPNRRGTTAFGPEWTEEISGDYIGLNMKDYLKAAGDMKMEPYIEKMAACGASYGGYSVYYLAGIHGNTFDCFIAHAGIFNEEQLYYSTEEMWFPNWDNGGLQEAQFDSAVGTPECPTGPAGDGETFGGIRQGGSPWSSLPKAARHYANSPHMLVSKWHTPILCIHGGNDFRIPYEQGMSAFNAAQMMGVPSRLVVFPDECHWILKPQNALFWHKEYFDWLDRWMKHKE